MLPLKCNLQDSKRNYGYLWVKSRNRRKGKHTSHSFSLNHPQVKLDFMKLSCEWSIPKRKRGWDICLDVCLVICKGCVHSQVNRILNFSSIKFLDQCITCTYTRTCWIPAKQPANHLIGNLLTSSVIGLKMLKIHKHEIIQKKSDVETQLHLPPENSETIRRKGDLQLYWEELDSQPLITRKHKGMQSMTVKSSDTIEKPSNPSIHQLVRDGTKDTKNEMHTSQ